MVHRRAADDELLTGQRQLRHVHGDAIARMDVHQVNLGRQRRRQALAQIGEVIGGKLARLLGVADVGVFDLQRARLAPVLIAVDRRRDLAGRNVLPAVRLRLVAWDDGVLALAARRQRPDFGLPDQVVSRVGVGRHARGVDHDADLRAAADRLAAACLEHGQQGLELAVRRRPLARDRPGVGLGDVHTLDEGRDIDRGVRRPYARDPLAAVDRAVDVQLVVTAAPGQRVDIGAFAPLPRAPVVTALGSAAAWIGRILARIPQLHPAADPARIGHAVGEDVPVLRVLRQDHRPEGEGDLRRRVLRAPTRQAGIAVLQSGRWQQGSVTGQAQRRPLPHVGRVEAGRLVLRAAERDGHAVSLEARNLIDGSERQRHAQRHGDTLVAPRRLKDLVAAQGGVAHRATDGGLGVGLEVKRGAAGRRVGTQQRRGGCGQAEHHATLNDGAGQRIGAAHAERTHGSNGPESRGGRRNGRGPCGRRPGCSGGEKLRHYTTLQAAT